jgi:hypothetical protein
MWESASLSIDEKRRECLQEKNNILVQDSRILPTIPHFCEKPTRRRWIEDMSSVKI